MSLRRTDGTVDSDCPWPITGIDVFAPSVPWRTLRWRHGQKHYSGTYWSSTMHAHVVYESRLELTRLLYADFDWKTTAVFAQPFLLSAMVESKVRRHVPDFLILREDNVPLVVDVKPRALLNRPRVADALGWARGVVLSRGWDFEIWCEPPEAELENLRFLAGYRRDWLFDEPARGDPEHRPVRCLARRGLPCTSAPPSGGGTGCCSAAVVEPAFRDRPVQPSFRASQAECRPVIPRRCQPP
ncbi:TnsA-like heteromeric transposase endonuclease subunit [Streptomyces zaomyceticus]|uniref:TnsA-like heteromeric transposase endonuclease subunit n=1 Tax=Streptomyces zaomyceticus TaxID=68286 RepID=UPI0036B8FFEB